MNFQGIVMNVGNLDRSIDFYRDLLGFTIVSRQEELAALGAPGSDRTQVLVLRDLGSSPAAGARHIGVRGFLLEVDTVDQLEHIASDLDSRGHLVSRRSHSQWSAVVGHDPDWVAVVVVAHPDGGQITMESWKTLDDFLYGIGE
jgi:catechol 2,3-dioxygenase-like lactoylglutathione lyase family enzyme